MATNHEVEEVEPPEVDADIGGSLIELIDLEIVPTPDILSWNEWQNWQWLLWHLHWRFLLPRLSTMAHEKGASLFSSPSPNSAD